MTLRFLAWPLLALMLVATVLDVATSGATSQPPLTTTPPPQPTAVQLEVSLQQAAALDAVRLTRMEKREAREARQERRAEARAAARAAERAEAQAEVNTPAPSSQPASGAMTPQELPEPWLTLAECESGLNPDAYNPDGPWMGLFQFAQSTWESVGGTGSPMDASVAEQLKRAQILQAQSGWGPWPVCGDGL